MSCSEPYGPHNASGLASKAKVVAKCGLLHRRILMRHSDRSILSFIGPLTFGPEDATGQPTARRAAARSRSSGGSNAICQSSCFAPCVHAPQQAASSTSIDDGVVRTRLALSLWGSDP